MSNLNQLILHSDLELVVLLLGHHLNLSLVDRVGNTLLHNAAYGGRRHLVAFLIQQGVEVGQRNHYGLTPLQMAIAGNHRDVVDTLVQHGAHEGEGDCMFGGGKGDEGGGGLGEGINCGIQNWIQSRTRLCSRPGNRSEKWLDRSTWEMYLSSEWIEEEEEGRRMLQELPKCACDIPVVSSISLTSEDFTRWYLARRQPVLLRGMVESWPAWKNWRKGELLNRLVHLILPVSPALFFLLTIYM